MGFGLLAAVSADPLVQANNAAAWVATGVVMLLLLAGLLVFSYTTKAGIIARSTTKESLRQPIFILSVAVAVVLLVLNTFLPFFSLGDDIKMLKDCGLSTILICSLLIAVWTASTSIADEIEGKTAMTLLSKPINRRQFILGKYVGILQTLLLFIIPTGLILLALVFYKVGYDAKESSQEAPLLADKLVEVIQVVPGLVLLFMEASVLGAISVAVATRLPMVVNLTIALPVFVIGHLTQQLVHSGALGLEYVSFMAKLIAVVLPGLEFFNMQPAIATGSLVPPPYLGVAAIYTACYAAASIMVAFILFEDRDLA